MTPVYYPGENLEFGSQFEFAWMKFHHVTLRIRIQGIYVYGGRTLNHISDNLTIY